MTLTSSVFTFRAASPMVGVELDWAVCMRSLIYLRAVKDFFLVAGQNIVDRFDAHHHRVIHVADLIAPGAKASARVNSLIQQSRLQHGQSLVTAERRDRIRVSDDPMIPRDDAPSVRLLQHFGLDQSRNDLLQNLLRIWIFA